ncbi:MAG: hypothetical protein AB7R00_28485 [Kofleriaceae bacterium]
MTDHSVPSAIVRGSLPEFPPPQASASGELPSDVVVVPTYKLHSPGQVGLATFFGGPLGGAWLIARNAKRLGQAGRTWQLVVGALVATAALAGLSVVGVPGILLAISGVFAAKQVARVIHGEAFEDHLRRGGRQSSSWVAFGLGIASLAITLAVATAGFAAILVVAQPPSIDMPNDSNVVYERGATKADAQRLGNTLEAMGYFASRPATVTVQRVNGRIAVGFVMLDSALDDEDMRFHVHKMAAQLSQQAFSGAAIDVWMIDEMLDPHHKLRWEDRPRVLQVSSEHVLEYRAPVTEDTARKLGEVLERRVFRPGTAASAIVERDGNRYLVTLDVAASVWDDPKLQTDYAELAFWFSRDAFDGALVDLRMQDADRRTDRVVWERRPEDPVVTAAGQEFYPRGVSRSEAEATAAILQPFLDSDGVGWHVEIIRADDRIALQFLVNDHGFEDRRFHAALIEHAETVGVRVFPEFPIDIRLTDGDDRVLTVASTPKHR